MENNIFDRTFEDAPWGFSIEEDDYGICLFGEYKTKQTIYTISISPQGQLFYIYFTADGGYENFFEISLYSIEDVAVFIYNNTKVTIPSGILYEFKDLL